MKHIICPKCGEVDFYTNFDIQKVYICYNANNENIDNRMEEVGVRSSIVPRCPYCKRKINIVEREESEGNNDTSD